MNILVAIITVLALAAFLVAALWLFFPQKKDSMNIHLDADTNVNISKGEDGEVHLRFSAAGGMPLPGEDDLFPPVTVDAPTMPLNRAFWLKVAGIEDLERGERAELCRILLAHDLITERERDELVDPAPEEKASDAAPEPVPAPWEENPTILDPADNFPPVLTLDDLTDVAPEEWDIPEDTF